MKCKDKTNAFANIFKSGLLFWVPYLSRCVSAHFLWKWGPKQVEPGIQNKRLPENIGLEVVSPDICPEQASDAPIQ